MNAYMQINEHIKYFQKTEFAHKNNVNVKKLKVNISVFVTWRKIMTARKKQ
jgi:hypothetical protein